MVFRHLKCTVAWPYSNQQSLQKNRLIFLQGLLFWGKNAVLEALFTILAQKSAIFSARINKWNRHAVSYGPPHFVGPLPFREPMPPCDRVSLHSFPYPYSATVTVFAMLSDAEPMRISKSPGSVFQAMDSSSKKRNASGPSSMETTLVSPGSR